MRRLTTLLILLLLNAGVLADSQVLAGNNPKPAQSHELLEAGPSVMDVLATQWQQQFSPVHEGRRLQSEIAWVRLTVQQPEAEPVIWWLDPWPMLLGQIQVYRQQDQTLSPLGQQSQYGPIAITLPPGNSTLYVQLHNLLEQPLALHWHPDPSAGQQILLRQVLASAALGAMSLLVLVTLGFMVLYRDRVYGLLAAVIAGHVIWLSASWLGSGDIRVPLAIHGLYLAAVANIIMVWTLQYRGPLLNGPHLGLLILATTGCLSAWLLPAGSASWPALLTWLGSLLGSLLLGLRIGIRGARGALEITVLSGLPLLVAFSLLLSSDTGLHALLAPSPGLLGCLLFSNAGILACLIRRTKHRWLDHEARQRLLNTVEDVTRSRGDILGRISHEIRTPMSGILGMAELLQETPLTPQQQEYVETIQGSGHSLLNLIGEVLDESTLAQEGSATNEIPFAPESLILEVIQGFRSLAEQRHIELIADISDTLPDVVIGDPVRLRQVLLHTLGYAVRTSNNGEASIQAQCPLHQDTAQLLIQVHGHGSGMNPPLLAHLLAQTGNTDNIPGATSAGLSVARRLVHMMGGDFNISSNPDSGTTIRFSLALPIERMATDAHSQDLQRLENQRVLIVDDSDTVLRTLSHQTERWGMRTDTARTSSEALGKTRNRLSMGQPYDVIILDHQLPGITGIELARRLRQIQEPPPAMLMLTGLRHFPSPAEYQAAGIRRLLTKPATGNALRAALITVLTPSSLETASVTPGPLQSLSVLLAEDNPVTARVIEAMLKKLGAHCTRVENGQQAVDACQRNHFDLVLMDCDMPVMDGYTATRTIREWETACNNAPVPIYALTAHILDEYREQSRRAGMNGHLGKPVALPQLATVLAACLEN